MHAGYRRSAACAGPRGATVLITEDKDFGELVFVRRLPHPCIVRFVDMSVAEKVEVMRELLEHHVDALLAGAIVFVTRGRVRVRRAEDDADDRDAVRIGP